MDNYYKEIYKPDKNRDRFWSVFARFLQIWIPKDSKVLDVGAGYCLFLNNIVAKEKHALDIEDISQYAKPGIHIIKSDCNNFKPGEYDIIFMSNMLEHLPKKDIIPLLKKLRDVCKNRIIILGPNYHNSMKYYWDDPTHETAISHVTMKRMLINAGFEIEKIYPNIIPFSVEIIPGSKIPPIPKFLMWMYLMLPYKPMAGQFLVIGKVRNG